MPIQQNLVCANHTHTQKKNQINYVDFTLVHVARYLMQVLPTLNMSVQKHEAQEILTVPLPREFPAFWLSK